MKHSERGRRHPRTRDLLGHEGLGVIDSVGTGVTTFKPEDGVLISCISSCGARPHLCRYRGHHRSTTGRSDGGDPGGGRAGIRTVMITGDHPRTAARIAADLGIVIRVGRR